ncbi:ribonuclease HII [Niabella ginsenosidivorans]|uniref:Ribonuclease HII n=1 Tax=Niabella ginsenosidivorans TaxID=1176587 RepID=A0A1A9I919_9BACT|nr:ribonuclease HII [Niabella ginsenosidivorans]ANH84063.1 ribonuclease HII [Niabella ginsenosidivorans]
MPDLLVSFQQKLLEAGCDEAGRGCYAGPVFAAAVILPRHFHHPLLNDSKLLKPSVRLELRTYIEAHALAFSVAQVSVEEIDTINILKASQKAMHIALASLKLTPEFIAVDGNYFLNYKTIPHACIVKGDGKFSNIAAASILAKTYRDEYMQRIHSEFPQYNWASNKGYGTQEHRDAIKENGICIYHRKSFNILPVQAALFE